MDKMTNEITPNEIAYYYEINRLGGFSTDLMRLFGRADTQNRAKLEEAFPEYAEAYRLWFYKPEGWDKLEGDKNEN
jgi:hypothetical protein